MGSIKLIRATLWCAALLATVSVSIAQEMPWRQVIQTGQAYEYQDRHGEASRSYLHAYRTASTNSQKAEAMELFGRLMVKIKRDDQALLAARRIMPLDNTNAWAKSYLKEASVSIETDRRGREPQSADINLVRARGGSPLYGIKSGDDWIAASKKHRFSTKEEANCGGRTMLQTFQADVSGRKLIVYVARNVVVRVDVSVPHQHGNDRRAVADLIEERHGKALNKKGDYLHYTPIAISDIPDVFVQTRSGFYDITVFNARAYVNIAQTMRNCATEEQIMATLNAVRRVAATAASRGGDSAGSRGDGGGWGALAIDANVGTRYGFSHNYSSRDSAVSRARSECSSRGGNGCSVVLTYSGGCAAYAASQSNGRAYGWGQGTTEAEAKSRAMSECGSRGGSCAVRSWSCN